MAMKAYSYFGFGVANILRLNPTGLLSQDGIVLKQMQLLKYWDKAKLIVRNYSLLSTRSWKQRKGHCYLLVNDVVSLVKELLVSLVVEGLRMKK